MYCRRSFLYLTHTYLRFLSFPCFSYIAVAAAADAAAAAKKATEEAARKQAKLAEMAKKVAALQKRKTGGD